MAEYEAFAPPHVLVRIRLIAPDATTLPEQMEYGARCTGYDPSGYGSYWIGLGRNRVRFRRSDGRELVGPRSTARWEICPGYLKQLPRFETTAEVAAGRAETPRPTLAERATGERWGESDG